MSSDDVMFYHMMSHNSLYVSSLFEEEISHHIFPVASTQPESTASNERGSDLSSVLSTTPSPPSPPPLPPPAPTHLAPLHTEPIEQCPTEVDENNHTCKE